MFLSALRALFAVLGALALLPLCAARVRGRPEYVRFRLKGDLPYRSTPRLLRLFRRADPAAVSSLHLFTRQLRVLAGDPRVRGVVLEVDGLNISSAKRAAVVDSLNALRKTGKEIVGYATSADTAAYELLCACDRVFLPPAGRLDLTGFHAEATALARGLSQLGITAHFVRRGEHKTAPELFTHEEVSPVQRMTIEEILDARYVELIASISRGRRLSADEAAERVNSGPYSAKRALERGLIDALVHDADLGTALLAEGTKEIRIASFRQYVGTRLWPPLLWAPKRPKVSVVLVQGMIAHGRGGGVPMGPSIAGSDQLLRSLRSAASDPRTRAIVLFIDSPGGSAIGSELVLEEVKRAAKKKPVLAYFERVAASGGYIAALGAKEIWSSPQALVGSIGVFAGKFELSGLFERLGIRRALVTRGDNAGIFSPSRGFTEHERVALEAEIEETYQVFLAHVAQARGKSLEEIRERAEGRVYTGNAAQQAGLVDRIGHFEQALHRALELSGTRAEELDVVIHGLPRRRLPIASLLQRAGGTHLYALWYPWWTVDGHGSLDFGP